MPTFTTNLKLKKPLQTDFYNVADFNGNFDAIDTAIGNLQSSLTNFGYDTVLVVLKAADWTGTSGAFTQTVDAENVIADESKQIIFPIPKSDYMNAYDTYMIKAIGQDDGKITFIARCDDQPNSDVMVYIAAMGVKQQ